MACRLTSLVSGEFIQGRTVRICINSWRTPAPLPSGWHRVDDTETDAGSALARIPAGSTAEREETSTFDFK